jgi:hypothetical protein
VKKITDQTSVAGAFSLKGSNFIWQLAINQSSNLTFSRITYSNSETMIEMAPTRELIVLLPLISRNEAPSIFTVKLTIRRFHPLVQEPSEYLPTEREISLRIDERLISYGDMVDRINSSMSRVYSLINPSFFYNSLPIAAMHSAPRHFSHRPEMRRPVYRPTPTQSSYTPSVEHRHSSHRAEMRRPVYRPTPIQSSYTSSVEQRQVRFEAITYTMSENNRNLGRLQISREKKEIVDLREQYQFQTQYRNEEWCLVIKRESEMTEAHGIQEIKFEYYENNQVLWAFHDECPSVNLKEEFVIPLYFTSGLAAPRLLLSTSSGESFPIPVEYIPVRTKATSAEKSAAEIGLQERIEPKNEKHSISYLLDHG